MGGRFRFKLFASSAELMLRGARRMIKDKDQAFDLFSRVISDPALDNTIVVQRDVITRHCSDDRRADWFGPVWRIPHQHRKNLPQSDEWLYATPQFCGMPGSMSPMDLDRRRTASEPTPARIRAPARVAPARPVLCKVTLQDERANAEKPDERVIAGYLLDYSPTGCRLELEEELGSAAVTKVHIAKGLPWPWRRQSWQAIDATVDVDVPELAGAVMSSELGRTRVLLHFNSLDFK